jgi:hypothetical protein
MRGTLEGRRVHIVVGRRQYVRGLTPFFFPVQGLATGLFSLRTETVMPGNEKLRF